MAKKHEVLMAAFASNVYPGMLRDLAADLGVTADSLNCLGLGWAPIVEFKKGANYRGWWAIPERDSRGLILGISLRSPDGMKVMYPGSKHGLVYPINPQHELGQPAYRPGPTNWVRTMEAGLECPVCGKPDGCLLSQENPADPQAVICIREPSAHKMRMGYLHIRKPEGRLVASSPLPDSPDPIIVVEGMTDTAAAMDLGFVAIGRPSNLACMDLLVELCRGREVIVVGENDLKPDGRAPGREGMVAACQVLRQTARKTRMVLPPLKYKDLRQWKIYDNLTKDQFLAYVVAEGQQEAEQTVLEDDRPRTVALTYLSDCYRLAGRHTLRRFANSWYAYAGSQYAEVSEEAFEAPIYPWAHGKQVTITNTKTGAVHLEPLYCDSGFVSNLARALRAEVQVPAKKFPCWINGASGPDAAELVVFPNGLLHVPAYLAGAPESEYLLAPTPDYFTTTCIGVPFDPTAKAPTWRRFLLTSLGDDMAKIHLLQEWFGYCLTPDTSMAKMMYLRGLSGAGKTVITNALQAMVGEDQAAAPSLRQLTTQFGLFSMLGKLVCTIADARDVASSDKLRGLEVLLNIAGNDYVQIDRKFKDPLAKQKLFCRITITSNKFLDIPDHEGAMLRRLNVIEFRRSFIGKEDWDLDRKLAGETQGIIVWALEGLRRLREQGRFTMPASSQEALQEWRLSTSPMASFLEDACDLTPGAEVSKDELWVAWTQWAGERGIRLSMKSRMFEQLRMNAPFVTGECYEDARGRKHNVFRGLTLKAWAHKALLGRPN